MSVALQRDHITPICMERSQNEEPRDHMESRNGIGIPLFGSTLVHLSAALDTDSWALSIQDADTSSRERLVKSVCRDLSAERSGKSPKAFLFPATSMRVGRTGCINGSIRDTEYVLVGLRNGG